jgi:hypothetical protein
MRVLAMTLLAGLALTAQQNPRGPATTSCDVMDAHPLRRFFDQAGFRIR